jgi:hypothetical protein
MNLNEIAFPVFQLGQKPSEEGGVLFFAFKKETKEEDFEVIKVVDDKNLEGITLGERRIKAKVSGATLFNLKYAIYFLGDLIKISRASVWYIDSHGKLFQYKKSTRVPLVFKKVKKRIHANGVHLVEVEGYNTRFKTLLAPNLLHNWAGILKTPLGPILYGLFDREYKSTFRKI